MVSQSALKPYVGQFLSFDGIFTIHKNVHLVEPMYESLYTSWIKGFICIRVTKPIILDVSGLEIMFSNLLVFSFNIWKTV